MAPPARSLYTVLGVTERSTAGEIRIAYLNLARNLHPDRQQGRSAAELALAERRMREVNDAYAVLCNAAKRRAYDEQQRSRSDHRRRPAGAGSSDSGRSASAPRTPRGPRPDNPERFDADPAWRGFGDEDDGLGDDDVELSPLVAFLLRRGPLIAVLALALVLFVGTAYAGAPQDPPAGTATTTTCPPGVTTTLGLC